MNRNLLLAMGSLTFVALAAFVLIFATGTNAAGTNPDAMSIDMDITGNTATALGTRESCARINENNTMDADETVVDTLTVDVTVENIPASNPMIGYGYTLYFPTAVRVLSEDQAFLLNELAGSALFAGLSDPVPDNSPPWIATAVDGGPVPGSDESSASGTGTGVLGRLQIESVSGAAAGLFPLTMTGNAVVDNTTVGRPPDVTNNAVVAVNRVCGVPVGGDVDCNGSVVAVDALKILRKVAGLSVSQEPGCAYRIGEGGPPVLGDVDCSAGANPVSAVDALKILRFIANLSVSQQPSCPPVG